MNLKIYWNPTCAEKCSLNDYRSGTDHCLQRIVEQNGSLTGLFSNLFVVCRKINIPLFKLHQLDVDPFLSASSSINHCVSATKSAERIHRIYTARQIQFYRMPSRKFSWSGAAWWKRQGGSQWRKGFAQRLWRICASLEKLRQSEL